MELTVTRRNDDGELGDRLETAAAMLSCRAGEAWSFAIEARAQGPMLLADGPARALRTGEWACEPGVSAGAPWRYRRALGSAPRWTCDALARLVRDLVWQPLEIAPNPIDRSDPALARAFESSVLDAFRDEPPEPVLVRFGVWHGEDDGPRYFCKVESVPSEAMEAAPAWRWWSALVKAPAELAASLEDALHRRPGLLAPGSARAGAEEFWGWGATGRARA